MWAEMICDRIAAEDDPYIGVKAGDGTGDSDWGIYIGSEPDTPEKTITIYETGLGKDDANFSDRSLPSVVYPPIQIRTRAGDPRAAYAKLEEIADLFRSLGNFTLDNKTALGVFRRGQITPLGKATNNTLGKTVQRYVLNFEIIGYRSQT